jgi:hypothetical protein
MWVASGDRWPPVNLKLLPDLGTLFAVSTLRRPIWWVGCDAGFAQRGNEYLQHAEQKKIYS